MNDHIFCTSMDELEKAIAELPASEQERLRELAMETHQRHQDIKDAIEQRKEFLENLNLALKYMVFDLEATKRENLAMRQRITDLHIERGDLPGPGMA